MRCKITASFIYIRSRKYLFKASKAVGSCDEKIKIDLLLADPLYNLSCKFGRQASNCGFLFSKHHITELLKMCVFYLKQDGHALMFCSADQFLFWIEDIPTSTDRDTYGDAGGKKKYLEDTIIDQEKQCLMFGKDRWMYSRSPHQRNLNLVSKFEHAMHI